MNETLARTPIDKALVIALRVGTQRPVEIMEAPKAPGNGPLLPYAILYPLPGGSFDGPPLSDPHADVTFSYQVTSVGKTAEQCQSMADRVRATMLGRKNGAFVKAISNPSGVKIMDRAPDGGPGGIDRATGAADTDNVVFSVPERYLITVTPA